MLSLRSILRLNRGSFSIATRRHALIEPPTTRQERTRIVRIPQAAGRAQRRLGFFDREQVFGSQRSRTQYASPDAPRKRGGYNYSN